MPTDVSRNSATLSGVCSANAVSASMRRSRSTRRRLAIAGHHDPLGGVGRVAVRLGPLDALARLDERLRVADADGGAHEDGDVEALGELERLPGERERLGGVRRLEHRDARECGVVAGVLLVLRGVHAGVVGDENHQAAANAGVRQREERIGGDVEADVLHGDERRGAGQRDAGGDLERDLLVGRPLGVDAGERAEALEDLRRRRAGIAHADRGTGFPGTLRDRFVSRQQHSTHAG